MALLPVLAIVPVLPLTRAAFLWANGEAGLAAGLVVIATLGSLALWAVLPRAVEVWPDSVRIVLGGPFTVSVGLDSIERVEAAPGVRAVLPMRWGAIFATSFRTTVRLRRTKGVSYMVSPTDAEGFTGSVEAALAESRN
jgi:hypothetical protein